MLSALLVANADLQASLSRFTTRIALHARAASLTAEAEENTRRLGQFSEKAQLLDERIHTLLRQHPLAPPIDAPAFRASPSDASALAAYVVQNNTSNGNDNNSTANDHDEVAEDEDGRARRHAVKRARRAAAMSAQPGSLSSLYRTEVALGYSPYSIPLTTAASSATTSSAGTTAASSATAVASSAAEAAAREEGVAMERLRALGTEVNVGQLLQMAERRAKHLAPVETPPSTRVVVTAAALTQAKQQRASAHDGDKAHKHASNDNNNVSAESETAAADDAAAAAQTEPVAARVEFKRAGAWGGGGPDQQQWPLSLAALLPVPAAETFAAAKWSPADWPLAKLIQILRDPHHNERGSFALPQSGAGGGDWREQQERRRAEWRASRDGVAGDGSLGPR